MATSGSIDFNFTAAELINYALRKLRRIASDQVATANQQKNAIVELNVMLKDWLKYEWLWGKTEGSVTLVANTPSYTLSPFPHRVISARFDNQDTETPLTLLTREEYFDLPTKLNTGIPTLYYVDYQRAAATLYVWPVMASVTDETVNFTFDRRFEDIDDPNNDLDIRQEHFALVGYNLAARLADDYGRDGNVINRVVARAEGMLEDAQDEEREEEIRFVVSEEA